MKLLIISAGPGLDEIRNIYGHAMFSVSNLLDTVGRDHLEAKKGQVQLPGRSFNFLLRFYY